ncbi:hypothetical protein CBS101457_003545 [Exobasidium rhododendri]|nr:hypothetical protein CBS101457_003545 [Exobasidium rhododendri]
MVQSLLYGRVTPPAGTTSQTTPHTRRQHSLDDLLSPITGSMRTASPEVEAISISSAFARTDAELADLLQGLNLIAQATRLDVCERASKDMQDLGQLILFLADHLGWQTWSDYWSRLVPLVVTLKKGKSDEASMEEERDIVDIYDLLQAVKRNRSTAIRPAFISLLPQFKKVLQVFSTSTRQSATFELMSGGYATSHVKAAKGVVESMLQLGIDRAELKRLPIAVALPLQEAIKTCQQEPPAYWNARAYRFIGREDLAKEITVGAASSSSSSATASTSVSIFKDSNGLSDCEPNRLFPNDYRLKEVNEILQTCRPIATRGPDVTGIEDQEVIAEQQKRVFISASDRVKSLSIGRGMFQLSSIAFKSTEQWKTPAVCLRIRMLNNCIVQHREPDPEGAEMEWPEFHNGVASALQLSISKDKVESSWLYSQLNKTFTSRHAGFIFGVGLLGQLRHLGKIHAHYYLSSRHSTTTIGLLLGISLSFLGSCDSLAKALMSIHLIHTLPLHSRPLATSMLEQSAALVGLGFVFMASKDRWTCRMAFKAIATENVMTDDNQMLKRECFSLSAAFSLGLTCLGKGRDGDSSLGGEIEKEIIPGLEKLIKSFSTDAGTSSSPSTTNEAGQHREDERSNDTFEWRSDISLTTTPASIALALIYLKSNRRDKMDKLPLPFTTAQLDHIRPDQLLVRALCRSLIAWDDISPDMHWLEGTLPTFLQFQTVKEVRMTSENCQMAYWNLRLGSLFAMALKYAGSNDIKARACLMGELHRYQSQVDLRPANFFDKIRKQMLQSSVDVLLICLCLVLAGTGDIEVLQELRRSLYKIDNLRYGNYMANSMAIGMLFLGAGRFTLSTSDSAVAALLLSFYPRFPIDAQDNRCHLQAYRHFWLLAVEARLLSVEDVKGGESSQMPIEMVLAGQTDPVLFSTPCLLPRLEDVESIKIASDRYFTSKIDLKRNSRHQNALIETRKLFVKKKAAELSHDDDKWGKSSLRARTVGFLVSTQLPLVGRREEQNSCVVNGKSRLGVPSQRSLEIQELRRLLLDKTNEKDAHPLVNVISSGHRNDNSNGSSLIADEEEEALELFTLQSILECILQDKGELLPTFLSLYTSTQAILNNTISQDALFFLVDLQALRVAMQEGKGKSTDGGEKSRSQAKISLIDPTFVESLHTLIQSKFEADLIDGNVDGGGVEGKQNETIGGGNRLRATLTRYATQLQTGHEATWRAIDMQDRQRLACLFVALKVAPCPILLQVKNLVMAEQGRMDREMMQVMLHDIFLSTGHQTSGVVLKILVEAWLP